MLPWLNHRPGHYLLLVAVGSFLFLTNLGGATLWDVDEAKNSRCTEEMWLRGDWLVPSFNGELRADKPAMLYWLQMAAYSQLGVTEQAARLPSALAALLTVLLTYELGRRLFNPATALLAGLALASTLMVSAAARFANPDALLNLFTTLTFFLFWRGYRAGGPRYPFASIGACMGLAVLAKGPVGVVLPTAVILTFLTWSRQLRIVWSPRLIVAVLAFCLVALPWYILVGAETKAAFLRGFIFKHNIERALATMENHHGSPLYYLGVLLVGFAPWSVFLGPVLWCGFWSAFGGFWPSALGRLLPSARDEEHATARPPQEAYRFLGCWIVGYLAFFTLAATKLPNYILPLSVPLALLTARFLDRWRRGVLQVPGWAFHLPLLALVLVGVATGVGLAAVGGLVAMPGLRQFEGLGVWAVIGVLPVLAAILAWWCLLRRYRLGLILTVTVAAVLFIGPLAAWGSAALNGQKAPCALVQESGALQLGQEIQIGCHELSHLPSLNFYCRRTIVPKNSEAEVLEFLRYPTPVYLFIAETMWEQMQAKVTSPHRVAARHYDMYRGGQIVVVTNR